MFCWCEWGLKLKKVTSTVSKSFLVSNIIKHFIVAQPKREQGQYSSGFWVGWVCAAKASKFGACFARVLYSKYYHIAEIGNFPDNPFGKLLPCSIDTPIHLKYCN